MPQLTRFQKVLIESRLNDGVSIRNVAAELHVSKNTVFLAKKKLTEMGEISRNQGSGRRKVTSQEEDENLLNNLRQNPFNTAIEAKEQSNFPASIKTARRRITNSELRNRCAANKIQLTNENRRARVNFARQFVHEEGFWENVVFSDEKTFQSCHNGRIRVYRPTGQRYNREYVHSQNKSGRFSVNVWGWVSMRGPGVCVILEERLTAEVYCRILNDIMIPSVTAVFGDDFVFQDDNCPVHRARIVRNFCEDHNINVLPWASKSPDLNVIENVWGHIVKSIYREDFRPRNAGELRQRIADAWQEITPEYTRQLVLSMPRRLQQVINLDGAMTKY